MNFSTQHLLAIINLTQGKYSSSRFTLCEVYDGQVVHSSFCRFFSSFSIGFPFLINIFHIFIIGYGKSLLSLFISFIFVSSQMGHMPLSIWMIPALYSISFLMIRLFQLHTYDFLLWIYILGTQIQIIQTRKSYVDSSKKRLKGLMEH